MLQENVHGQHAIQEKYQTKEDGEDEYIDMRGTIKKRKEGFI